MKKTSLMRVSSLLSALLLCGTMGFSLTGCMPSPSSPESATDAGTSVRFPDTVEVTDSATAPETAPSGGSDTVSETETEPSLHLEVPDCPSVLFTPAVPQEGRTGGIISLRADLPYFFEGKRQYRLACPVAVFENLPILDADALSALFGFQAVADGDTLTWTRGNDRVIFTVGKASVTVNGQEYAFPTVIRRNGQTVLLAADYLARMDGYQVIEKNGTVYFVRHPDELTEEVIEEIGRRFDLYRDIVYRYDHVECDQTGVGLYEKTPCKDRLVGISYAMWHTPEVFTWGSNTWDVPLDGPYLSDDPAVLTRHAIQLREAGVDFIFIDWTNHTDFDRETMGQERPARLMTENATDALFEVWSKIPGAPKVCLFAGPGHAGQRHVHNGNHQKKVDQIYRDYVEKYPDLYFHYEGKPLLLCYGATPVQFDLSSRRLWKDDRFTVRWITGYVGEQPGLSDRETMRSNGYWSWEERGTQTYATIGNRVECVTCSAATRPADPDIPACFRDSGATLKRQFQRACDLGAGIALVVSWNEWVTSEQPSPDMSRDIEPSKVHGTFYYDLLTEQIRKFKGQI